MEGFAEQDLGIEIDPSLVVLAAVEIMPRCTEPNFGDERILRYGLGDRSDRRLLDGRSKIGGERNQRRQLKSKQGETGGRISRRINSGE